MPKHARPLAKSVRHNDPRTVQERLLRLKLQYELLDQRIGRVEEGLERADDSLVALCMRREGLRRDMESQYRLLAS